MMKKTTLTIVLTISTRLFSQVGINTPTPTETIDINGIARIRNLPLNNSSNAIHTTGTDTASLTQNQSFTGARAVIADTNGVLGYLDSLPSLQKLLVSVSVSGVQNIKGGNPVTADYINENTDVMNAWTNNMFTVPTNMGGIYGINMHNSTVHTPEPKQVMLGS